MNQKIITSRSFKVLSTIQDVELRLKKPVTKQAFGKLFALLEDAQKECPNLDLHDKIISLYGKVVDRYVDTEVQKIATLATKPNCNLTMLRKKIADVKLYGVSKENFSILEKVEQGSLISSPLNQENPIIDIEWIEELFALASLIYHKKEEEEIRTICQNLPTEVQKCLTKHLTSLRTTLFQNDLSTIQALFAAAHELAERPLAKYPTFQDIQCFFKEEKNTKKADHLQYWSYKIN